MLPASDMNVEELAVFFLAFRVEDVQYRVDTGLYGDIRALTTQISASPLAKS